MGNKVVKNIQDAFDVGAAGTASIIGSMLTETVVGQFLPGVTNSLLAYKQKRFERNMGKFVDELKEKEEEINRRLLDLEEMKFIEFKDKFMGLITDYVINEAQEEKINYIVNGILNLSKHECLTEDLVLTYYDTLKELRLADIAVLKFYCDLVNNDLHSLFNETGINNEQYNAIRKKLARMGLLQTRRDEEIESLYKNVIDIEKHLKEINKGKKKELRLKSLSNSNSYRVTRFGRSFINFFVNELKESQF